MMAMLFNDPVTVDMSGFGAVTTGSLQVSPTSVYRSRPPEELAESKRHTSKRWWEAIVPSGGER